MQSLVKVSSYFIKVTCHFSSFLQFYAVFFLSQLHCCDYFHVRDKMTLTIQKVSFCWPGASCHFSVVVVDSTMAYFHYMERPRIECP